MKKSAVQKHESIELIAEKGLCPFCGTSESEIKEKGVAGCAFCYDIFSNEIENKLRIKYGNISYSGKEPGKAQALVPVYKSSAIAISSLSIKEAKKRHLNLAIKEERFEDAAKLRDEIKLLEKGDGE